MKDNLQVSVEGIVKIWDPESQEVFVNQRNAINPEAMSLFIAKRLANQSSSYISEMHFGNGGAIIDSTGNVTYKDVYGNLESGVLAGLFNATYFKVVAEEDTANDDVDYNNVVISHTEGLKYTDVVVTCTLAAEQPSVGDIGNLYQVTQEDYDNAAGFDGEFVFSEIGLKARSESGDLNAGDLLTHIVFHPVQKSANRVIQIVYTLRIRIV